MLERMIVRYANRKGFSVSELDRSPGDEAGIKHVSFEVRIFFFFFLHSFLSKSRGRRTKSHSLSLSLSLNPPPPKQP